MFLKENEINGEYWITQHGDAHYCDGDVGDVNHDGYVLDSVHHEIADAVGFRYGDMVDWEELEKFMIEQERELSPKIPSDIALLNKAFQRHRISKDMQAVAQGQGSPQEFAMKKWGWKRVLGHNIESWNLTPNDLKTIASGIEEILDQEGVDHGDDEGFTYHVSAYATGRSFELTLQQLEAGTTGNINPTNAAIDRNQNAAQQQFKNMEKDTQHPYYKNLGDCVVSFAEWLKLKHLPDTLKLPS